MPGWAAECWNQEIENMPPDLLRPFEEGKLRIQLEYTWNASAFYADKWLQAGVDSRRVRSIADLALLPFTETDELHQALEAAPPLGNNRCAPLHRLVRVQATCGSSERPLRTAVTRHDIEVYYEVGARAGWAAGLRPGDALFQCMTYSRSARGVPEHMPLETPGAAVAPLTIGPSGRLIKLIRDTRLHVALSPTPSCALGLADIYGVGALAPLAAQCKYGGGLHWVGQGAFIAELVDPASGMLQPLAEGAEGELVFTTIDREAHPLIRFRSHDHVRILGTGPHTWAHGVPLPGARPRAANRRAWRRGVGIETTAPTLSLNTACLRVSLRAMIRRDFRMACDRLFPRLSLAIAGN